MRKKSPVNAQKEPCQSAKRALSIRKKSPVNPQKEPNIHSLHYCDINCGYAVIKGVYIGLFLQICSNKGCIYRALFADMQ